MNVLFYNADVLPIYIECYGETIALQPKEQTNLKTDQNGEIIISLKHHITDKFNIAWYIMNEIFTLEQMRTVLVVDGIYKIKVKNSGDLVKIRNREYVFNKNISYDTFVFNMVEYDIQILHLSVVNSNSILKKSKFLYLFGGSKTLFPLFTVALFATIISMLNNQLSFSNVILIVVLCFVVFIGFINYLNSIKLLKHSIREEEIIKYMYSERKEYRKLTDNLKDKQLYFDSNNEKFI